VYADAAPQLRPRVAEDSVGESTMLLTRIALGLAAAAPLAQSAFGQHAEPFHIRNLNPLVAIFGLPAWDTVAPGTQFGASLELANHYRLSLRGTDLLILDGETLRTNLSYSHGFANGWSLGAEAPYYRISGGVLDDFTDGWHSASACLMAAAITDRRVAPVPHG
jgi:hypothetical protein